MGLAFAARRGTNTMGSRMLIDATHPEETRVVVVKGNRIEEFDFESAARRQLKGNIYLAKVTRVEPSLQAAFVEYGGNRHGFLAFAEIHPDYYQIPLADRQALIAEQEAEDAEHDDDDNNGHHHHRDERPRAQAVDAGQPDEIVSEHPAEDEEPAGAEASGDDGGQEADGGEDQGGGDDSSPAAGEQADPPEAHDDDGNGSAAGGQMPAEASAPAPHVSHGMPAELGNGIEVVEEDPENQKIESVGAEDALEEVPQRRRKPPRRRNSASWACVC